MYIETRTAAHGTWILAAEHGTHGTRGSREFTGTREQAAEAARQIARQAGPGWLPSIQRVA